jgi:hypothetical protein
MFLKRSDQSWITMLQNVYSLAMELVRKGTSFEIRWLIFFV